MKFYSKKSVLILFMLLIICSVFVFAEQFHMNSGIIHMGEIDNFYLDIRKVELITYVTPLTFSKEVLQETRPVIVYFYADWCVPCQVLESHYKFLAETYPQAKFVKYNIDQDKKWGILGMSYQYGVTIIPTVACFHKGKEVKNYRAVGGNIVKMYMAVGKFIIAKASN